MDITKAMQIIKEACASISANLQTHSTIQQAIQLVEAKLSERIIDSKDLTKNKPEEPKHNGK